MFRCPVCEQAPPRHEDGCTLALPLRGAAQARDTAPAEEDCYLFRLEAFVDAVLSEARVSMDPDVPVPPMGPRSSRRVLWLARRAGLPHAAVEGLLDAELDGARGSDE